MIKKAAFSTIILNVLFTGVLLFSFHSKANRCHGVLSNNSNRQFFTTVQSVLVVSPANFDDKATQVAGRMNEILQSKFVVSLDMMESLTRNTTTILTHILQNVIQHGSIELARVPVAVVYRFNEESMIVEIQNPQVKPFPAYLQREFTNGEKINVPFEQRHGFTGNGVALSGLIDSARQRLPSGSSVSWEADGQTVFFRLKINIASK